MDFFKSIEIAVGEFDFGDTSSGDDGSWDDEVTELVLAMVRPLFPVLFASPSLTSFPGSWFRDNQGPANYSKIATALGIFNEGRSKGFKTAHTIESHRYDKVQKLLKMAHNVRSFYELSRARALMAFYVQNGLDPTRLYSKHVLEDIAVRMERERTVCSSSGLAPQLNLSVRTLPSTRLRISRSLPATRLCVFAFFRSLFAFC